jgi:hypothetical protein
MTINENSEFGSRRGCQKAMRMMVTVSRASYVFWSPSRISLQRSLQPQNKKKKAHNFACRVTKSSITSSEPPAIAFTRTSLYNLST